MAKSRYLPLVIFLGLVAVFAWQLVRNSAGDDPKVLESALVGKSIPHFRLPALDPSAGEVSDAIFQQSSPLLLNVWATWCPTCYAEHQYLNILAKREVAVIGINYKDKRDGALKWLDNLGNPYQQNIFDEKGMLGLDLGVYGAPETFVVDCRGVVRYRYAGAVDEQVWQEKLQPHFEQISQEGVCEK